LVIAATGGAVGGRVASAESPASTPRDHGPLACAIEAKTVQTASDAFYTDHSNIYPNGTGPANTGGTGTTEQGQPVDISALVSDKYLSTFPPSNATFSYTDTIGNLQGSLGHGGKACSAKANGGGSIAACVTDALTVQTASDGFASQFNVYPNGTGPANTGGTGTTVPGQAVDISALVFDGFLRNVPPTNETFSYSDAHGSVQGFLDDRKKPC
jgi:hypothetical protein